MPTFLCLAYTHLPHLLLCHCMYIRRPSTKYPKMSALDRLITNQCNAICQWRIRNQVRQQQVPWYGGMSEASNAWSLLSIT